MSCQAAKWPESNQNAGPGPEGPRDFRNFDKVPIWDTVSAPVSRSGQIEELRAAVRFPLKLPVAIKSQTNQHQAETGDISSGGVLFYVDADLTVGSTIEFSIAMPAQILGTGDDVHVQCVGRVVRSFAEEGRKAIAAVIDEYKFERLHAENQDEKAARQP